MKRDTRKSIKNSLKFENWFVAENNEIWSYYVSSDDIV